MSKPGPSTSTTSSLAFLEYTGIPRSWLSKRPKLPSRNWLIFLGVTSSLSCLYFYDRQQCKKIKQQYIDRVKHLADEPLGSMDLPRKVTVYSSRWPGDEDYERGTKYFKKYVKPYLVAAAIDYDIVNGKRHGALTEIVANRIKMQRRREAGLEPPQPGDIIPVPGLKTAEARKAHMLKGGNIIMGRTTLKEYLEGLHQGWTEPLKIVEKEQELARLLADDGVFDEPDSAPSSSPTSPPIFHPLQIDFSSRHTAPPPPDDATPPPQTIPPQPPLLLVPFVNHIGLAQIPHMLYEFFNRRKDVKKGAQVAMLLINPRTRPFQESDLEWDKEAESYYKSSTEKLPTEIEEARKSFYKALPEKLALARALANREREPTKAELAHPPPSDMDLRVERLQKEVRWRDNIVGWNIVKPDAPASWDDRFRDSLSVIVDHDATDAQSTIF
ncbi:hypothetical protein SISSUDRAFT_1020454 [Sistotremastrum suecicum HHB10207 ss-3]|uniref:Mitochondrial import inner membrane translocase subunit TIM54 n=1 Tax=Sistotremastrum suecicum HHB10207 ss-3 TaxID=1314776 RepID=A0A166E631_9AGAM|nr:hypothetical protein SISSUDRAFT_1020454 [Sistotremastrum suecicum HHB10207 ss-3]